MSLKELAGREVHHQISLSHFSSYGNTSKSTSGSGANSSASKSRKKFRIGVLGKWYGGLKCNDIDVMDGSEKSGTSCIKPMEGVIIGDSKEKQAHGECPSAVQQCSYRASSGGDSPCSFLSECDEVCNSYRSRLVESLIHYVEHGQHCMECDGSFIEKSTSLGVKLKGEWQLHVVCSSTCQTNAVERLSVQPPAA